MRARVGECGRGGTFSTPESARVGECGRGGTFSRFLDTGEGAGMALSRHQTGWTGGCLSVREAFRGLPCNIRQGCLTRWRRCQLSSGCQHHAHMLHVSYVNTRAKPNYVGFLGSVIMFFTVFGVLDFSSFRRSKTDHEAPKTAPRRPKWPPRGPQDGPRGFQNGPKGAEDGTREPQEGPKRGPRGGTRTDNSRLPPQEAPRKPQEASKRPQDAPKRGPRGPKEAQKETPRGPQRAPKRPQTCLQEAPERPPHEIPTKIQEASGHWGCLERDVAEQGGTIRQEDPGWPRLPNYPKLPSGERGAHNRWKNAKG